MGYTAAGAHVHADELGDALRRHGRPDRGRKARSPRSLPARLAGRPAFEQAENKELAPLADLDQGREAEIVRLAEHDGELLHWFYDEGFVPGTQVVIREKQPAAGRFKVLLRGTDERAIGEKAAAGLFVRPS